VNSAWIGLARVGPDHCCSSFLSTDGDVKLTSEKRREETHSKCSSGGRPAALARVCSEICPSLAEGASARDLDTAYPAKAGV
jgi:hypothetical protein